MGAGSSSTRAALSGNKPNNIEMYSKIEAGEAGATTEEDKQRSLSFFELLYVLRAYFWPDEGTDGAFVNRVRSSATWVMVALSKSCNLLNPYFLAAATNALTDGRYKEAAQYIILYCSFRALSSLFKELQSIIYMKVKQQANIQLTEKTFTHVHSLSLNWHLSKQMGNVIRSMDRGTAAADTLVRCALCLLRYFDINIDSFFPLSDYLLVSLCHPSHPGVYGCNTGVLVQV